MRINITDYWLVIFNIRHEGRTENSCRSDEFICCNTDVVGTDPVNWESIEHGAVWDMPAGPSRHGQH